MPAGRPGRIVERCRPTPELAGGSLFGALGGGWLSRVVQLIQRADGGGDHLWRNRRVTGGGVDLAMAEQHLDDADVGTVFQQVGGEGVAQSVNRDSLADSRVQGGFAAGQL